MANEISVTAKLSVTKDGGTVTGDTTKAITLAGAGKYSAVQAIGTSAEQIDFPGDMVAEGVTYYWLKNLDAANPVDIARDAAVSTHIFATLKAGQFCLVPCNKAAAANPTIYAKATGGTINLQVVAAGT